MSLLRFPARRLVSPLVVHVRHSSSNPNEAPSRPTKSIASTALSYSYTFGPEHCDQHGTVYGGEVLKVVDFATGTVATRHSASPGLTASLDRVLFFGETRAGAVLHLSASMNRAFESSMEVQAQLHTPARTLALDAILTFVALPRPLAPPSPLAALFGARQKVAKRAPLPVVSIGGMRDADRVREAGNRREARKEASSESERIKRDVRAWLWANEPEVRLGSTVASSMQIVMPADSNSKNILFGGTLIRWLELAATLPPLSLSPSFAWSTSAIESFAFRSSALIGNAVYLRAVVTGVWDDECEVFVVAMGGCGFKEDRFEENPKLAPVADAFFTISARDKNTREPAGDLGMELDAAEEGSALEEMRAGAEGRREAREAARRLVLRNS